MHVCINRAKIQIKNDIRKRTRVIMRKKMFLGIKIKNILIYVISLNKNDYLCKII